MMYNDNNRKTNNTLSMKEGNGNAAFAFNYNLHKALFYPMQDFTSGM
ncbi:MAG: hypothetical protein LUE65_01270 [Clostridiales bacterium]|nr:hypothetical protein [Clostridiales bacterium]